MWFNYDINLTKYLYLKKVKVVNRTSQLVFNAFYKEFYGASNPLSPENIHVLQLLA